MAMTPSLDLPLGTTAPDFSLPDTDNHIVSLHDAKGSKAVLVMFISNHCPYVKHIKGELAKLTREYITRGVSVFGIMSNDVLRYPDDAPEMMKKDKTDWNYAFPYLYDESQEIARNYRAQCTPEFYVFDAEYRLAYHGQMDDSRPGNGLIVDGNNLRNALDAVLNNKSVPLPHKSSIGCNIKWK